MKRLGLDTNPIDDIAAQELAGVIHKIDALRVRECKITNEGVKTLSENIAKRNTPVIYAYFSFVYFSFLKNF